MRHVLVVCEILNHHMLETWNHEWNNLKHASVLCSSRSLRCTCICMLKYHPFSVCDSLLVACLRLWSELDGCKHCNVYSIRTHPQCFYSRVFGSYLVTKHICMCSEKAKNCEVALCGIWMHLAKKVCGSGGVGPASTGAATPRTISRNAGGGQRSPYSWLLQFCFWQRTHIREAQ